MTSSEIVSVGNGWHRADTMFKHLNNSPPVQFVSVKTFFTQPVAIYMFLAFSLLFAVLEFLKEKDSIPPSIASEIDAHWDTLRLFRNAVFHIQPEIHSPKMTPLLESSLDWKTVYHIHQEIGRHYGFARSPL